MIAGVASAKTVTVSITKNGYVPNTVTIAVGDTVQFTNSDTVAHQVVFKPATGVTCAPNPLVLQPAQTGTCTFAAPGNVHLLGSQREGKHLPRNRHGGRGQVACGRDADARGEAADSSSTGARSR